MSRKKEQILKKAKELFMEQGLQETSLEQIGEEVPASKMTIYKYFTNKEGLIEQVLNDIVEEVLADFYKMLDHAEDNPLEGLMELQHYEGTDKISEKFIMDLVKYYPKQAERLLTYQREEIFPRFEQFLFEAQKKGQIRKDISPHVLTLFISSIKQFFSKPENLVGITDINAIRDQFMTILYYGIISPDHKKN
ncbi:TetR/AcrR family transcriptional regulator [Chengkuizengella axinellae]|uniref:TetR/AcrR family transcriptional regulator n=1 Tax=Chengkuizengella axinellae TaxID=3064388 RepID=A0ABT9IWI4_9BACL|nr:TetR/AcrR family transcriptional regulator [Chengkuizengella sp. 2205SS18-9]MDP5273729.1 TetR/AcrR family transcriptional regulator [Chengkuizengella sp. 2205SS18-9]